MGYGERYLDLRRFVDYCRKLNVSVDDEELEYYEKTGLMLPVARVVMPDDYVVESHRRIYESNYIPKGSWPEIDRLFNDPSLPDHYAKLSDDNLIDSFDREFGRNPYLFRPDANNYKPWNSYRVSVEHPQIPQYTKPSVTHYYAYWQVYQLYEIQKSPDLYENLRLLDKIPEDVKKASWLPRTKDVEFYQTFRSYARSFDALSFFITMFHREHRRTFATVQVHHGVQKLNGDELRSYQDRLAAHAKSVAAKYSLKDQDLFDFLTDLLYLLREYRSAERLKLAGEVENDIGYQAEFAARLTGKDWEGIASELEKRAGFGLTQDFRYLNPSIRARDQAKQVLLHDVKEYAKELSDQGLNALAFKSFSENEIDELLNFCDKNGLSILSHAASEMIITDDDPRRFWRVTRYTNLKNLATSLEYFLKAIAETGKIRLPSRATFKQVVEEVMKHESGWINLFKLKQNTELTRGENSAQFLTNLVRIINEPQFTASEDSFWARNFLIACLARNLSVHTYPTEDWLYGDLFRIMLRSVIYCILYSWLVAKREHWV